MNQEDEKIYQKVKETFAASTESDEILAGYTKKLTGNAAKYSDAWGYASRVGGNVSDALLGAAPEIFNAEDGYDVVMSALRDGYEMTSKYAAGVQTLANREAGIGLKGVEPDFMTGRASGIAHAASNAEDLETTEAYLGQPVQLFTENVVGDTIKANEEFQYKSGLNPKIRRTAAADCCEWCNDVAGDYSYPADDLIYRRHANCNCLVEYYPGNGLKQNTHTKKWSRQGSETVGLGASSETDSTLIPKHKSPKVLPDIDINNREEVQKLLDSFENDVVNDTIENALVITSEGHVYQCYGVEDRVWPDYDLGADRLKGAVVSHNHVKSETTFSFGDDDYTQFRDMEIERLCGFDYRFRYTLTRENKEIDSNLGNWDSLDDFQHNVIADRAERDGFGYQRERR